MISDKAFEGYTLTHETNFWFSKYFNSPKFIAKAPVILNNHAVFGEWGYVLSIDEINFRELAVDLPGWAQNHKDKVVSIYLNALNDPEFDCITEDRVVVNISFPGVYTYGHWLLDILPKIYFFGCRNFNDISNRGDYLYALPKSKWWFGKLLSIFNITDSRVVNISNKQKLMCNTLVIPGKLRSEFSFDREFYGDFFAFMRERLLSSSLKYQPKGKFLFVLKRTMSSSLNPRILANEGDLIEVIKELGGDIYDPVDDSLEIQANRFNAYGLIIGEDSSALHNVIFCSPGEFHLLVISSPKINNLLHVGLMDVLHGKFSVIEGVEDRTYSGSGSRFYVDVDRLSNLILDILSSKRNLLTVTDLGQLQLGEN